MYAYFLTVAYVIFLHSYNYLYLYALEITGFQGEERVWN